ncbi:hypothetical protein HBN50_08925 [Halobacteriovorax sp. GB3]|uniref:ATP-grasp domain-containing protein n=1 Tax=Halobacteriovorax sp. GB3 TaxID=2719615 RepID=UPI00235F7C29|nr:hypothetical protein [Halobacteriovorax sp. GB3]MDD0853219.1 hypothetical protein [Halobacteriovorax sp. GB3]
MRTPKLLIFTENPLLYSVKRLWTEAQFLSLNIQNENPFKDFSHQSLNDCDIILNRISGIRYTDTDLDLCASKLAFNDPHKTLALRDKSKQARFFTDNSIAHPQTQSLDDFMQLSSQTIKAPYMVKPLRGNQGRGILYIDGNEKLEAFYREKKEQSDTRYIVQSFVKKIREWRILFIGTECLGALEKTELSLIANASKVKCQYREVSELPKALIELSLMTHAQSGLFYSGIDMIEDENQNFIVLEINTTPGFEVFEKESKLNIAKNLLEQMLKERRRNLS